MSKASIMRAYNTAFGAFVHKDKVSGLVTDSKSFYHLLVEAGHGTIEGAGLEAKNVDAVWVGSCSPSSFVNQEHIAPLAAEIHPSLRFKPMTRCGCACAWSSVALYDAVCAIEAGMKSFRYNDMGFVVQRAESGWEILRTRPSGGSQEPLNLNSIARRSRHGDQRQRRAGDGRRQRNRRGHLQVLRPARREGRGG